MAITVPQAQGFEDILDLAKPKPSMDDDDGGFSSLLTSSSMAFEGVPWDVGVASHNTSEGFEHCTEGLGCESSDCCSHEAFPRQDDDDDDDKDFEEDEAALEEKEERSHALKAFPPPLSTLCSSNAVNGMMSVKKDGRFMLLQRHPSQTPFQNFLLHSFRDNGRLKMHFHLPSPQEHHHHNTEQDGDDTHEEENIPYSPTTGNSSAASQEIFNEEVLTKSYGRHQHRKSGAEYPKSSDVRFGTAKETCGQLTRKRYSARGLHCRWDYANVITHI